jgi:methionyl-tRNA formyltransferase
MLCGNRQSSRIMYNGLAAHVDIVGVIVENKPSAKIMIQRRIKNLGVVKTVGQLLFLITNKLLAKAAENRINQLMLTYGLNDEDFPSNITKKVDSINSEEAIALLKGFNPDSIVVNGTRIISQNVLSSVGAPFINTHAGITPRYRGTHGGYWALAKQDPDNCGVTIHLVDQGIDTGGVLYQDIIRVEKCDSLNTYPMHQMAKAIPLMQAALNDVQENNIRVKQGVFPSNLWYHPTLFEYVRYWLQKGVK